MRRAMHVETALPHRSPQWSADSAHRLLRARARIPSTAPAIYAVNLVTSVTTRLLAVAGRMTHGPSVESARCKANVLVYGKIYSVCLDISVAGQEGGSH